MHITNRNTKYIICTVFLTAVLLFSFGFRNCHAFSGCEEGCEKCHSLGENEVRVILGKVKAADAKILRIQMSPVKGLWEVDIDDKGQRGLFYVDFSRRYVVSGSVIEVDAAINKTKERLDELNKDRRISPAGISLKDALVLGSANARRKVIAFTDPD